MSARAISQALLCSFLMAGFFSPAHALTQQELVAKLEAAGYSQIRDIKSTAEGTAVKARMCPLLSTAAAKSKSGARDWFSHCRPE
jgi:hypothetical protein